MNYKEYINLKIEIGLLLVAILFTTFSIAWSYYASEYMWFARSGSIMVLCAIIVEYKLYNMQIQKISSRMQQTAMSRLPLNARPTKFTTLLGRVAHSEIILGTIIWGYGDLIKY